MDERVRTYLIEVARQHDKFVFYSDVIKHCNLEIDLSYPPDHDRFSKILGDVSAFEDKYGRPLLTSLAIYKDPKLNDHGDGFYKVAELLGKGKAKKLKADLYGFTEAQECRRFWQNDDNYKKFATLSNGIIKKKEIDFFTKAELDFFKQWQLIPYDPSQPNHVEAKNILMETVWEKSIYLGNLIVQQLPGFSLEAKKIWHKLGSKEEQGKKTHAMQFKHYTWVKVFRNSDKGKQIYFTFGVDAHPETEAFIYKIDCQRERGTTLSPQQIELCLSLIPNSARWNEIEFDNLLSQNWQTLTTICVNFVKQFTTEYDVIIDAVWGGDIPPSIFKNKLIKKDKPKDGFESMPERKKVAIETDTDFLEKAKAQKDLGDKGEALVKQREIEFLQSHGYSDKAELVEIVKDGKGYDVYSFDEFGNEKFIEVKTTTGNEYAAFFLSENEIDFMRNHINQYSIYRVYEYDEDNNFGKFFELNGNVESQLIMKPTLFKVLIKKEI